MPDASHIHTVLLVEDEADLRSLFTLVLEIAGFRVTSVARAEEALEALAQERFAVVLTDYQLEGGMSGDALIREIHTKDSGVVTMLMSAHPNLSSIGDACQANAVFWKGTELAQLPVLIRLLLSRSL